MYSYFSSLTKLFKSLIYSNEKTIYASQAFCVNTDKCVEIYEIIYQIRSPLFSSMLISNLILTAHLKKSLNKKPMIIYCYCCLFLTDNTYIGFPI